MRYAMVALIVSVSSLPLLGGCGDKVVREKETQSTSGITGNSQVKTEKTMERPDGTRYETTDTHKAN